MCLSIIYAALVVGIHVKLTTGYPQLLGAQAPTFTLHSREEWGAESSTDVRPLKTPVPYVVIHHTYQPAACDTTEQCKAAMKSMQNYHNSLDWGDIGYNDPDPSTDLRSLETLVPYVVIHHTYQPAACDTTAQCKSAMKAMQNYHISLDWGDIGYNFCVGSEGGAYEGRGWHNRGIHAGQANNVSIGICLIGDWRVEQPPPQMLETTKQLISAGVSRGVISAHYQLKAHSQLSATECPGAALLSVISTWEHFAEGEL